MKPWQVLPYRRSFPNFQSRLSAFRRAGLRKPPSGNCFADWSFEESKYRITIPLHRVQCPALLAIMLAAANGTSGPASRNLTCHTPPAWLWFWLPELWDTAWEDGNRKQPQPMERNLWLNRRSS